MDPADLKQVEMDNPIMSHRLDLILAEDGQVVTSIRARFANVIAVYAFGSQISGAANARSDLDLAVLVAGYADPLALWTVANNLANVVGCEVDLLDLRAASTVMQYLVITTGKCLWSCGVDAGLFECYVLSEKTALDTARAPILADIALTGTVYGR
jgi:predicted nucleotidyltransferase